ncbi:MULTISPECIES: ABC transporter substrate-binding protein [Gordonibacter]|uniref:ABC transporter substrate-binding protein n=1 Tax=Gordonibacter faecis TaxID=3047475 RepID=A0ABT7DLV6_9ACTN|nr:MULTISPECIES: ABC transporter substrate-binding protein [unclassified Gordonibacter]MDJ1650505.1 ABC transporter substrate-binding protein [Gordonibacter sp. KGMB12511]HIW76377.1 ABC transporter substrate-binding protein [Candidatus Gordonibacter avicola]
MSISRRSFCALSGVAAATACLGLVGCGDGKAPQAEPANQDNQTAPDAIAADFREQGKGQHLVVGRRGKLFKIAPSVIADKLGYFAEEGCDVEFQQVELAEAFASLATGNLDVMLMGVVQTCEYIAKGTPMYMFGGTVLNGTEILATDAFDTPLNAPEDFKGLRIGFQRSETGQIHFRAWLKQAGLDIEGGDVTFIPLDNEQANVEATLKGEVDLCLVNNAFGYINSERGIKVVGAVPNFTGDYPCCRQNASEKAYKQKFRSLVDFEIAILRGYQVFKNDPDTAIPLMVEYSEQSEDYVRAALYGSDTYEAVMNLSPDPCRNAVIDFYESLKTVGTIDTAAPPVDDFVVTDVYRAALDTLMEREPNEQVWKDLDALYRQNDE